MLTRWLTLAALLAGLADPQKAAGALTVKPTCRVKGHPEVELTLTCGDGKKAGLVRYWHTPFGDLQTPGFLHSKLDPVFMHRDGSLVMPNSSALHSGLYYCFLQHAEGTTLWPYQLHVGNHTQKRRGRDGDERRGSCDAFRFRRDVGSGEEQGAVSDGKFAGAVAASVLLTFVLGFSTGALTRTHVLRCLGAVATKVRSSRQRHRQSDTDQSPVVAMTTAAPLYDNGAFEMGRAWDEATLETTISSTASSPPAKPKRSFKQKPEEHQETAAYLEGCDCVKEDRRTEERNKGCEGEEEEEEREFSGFCLLGEDEASQTDTDDKSSEDGEEQRDGRESREEEEEEGDDGEEKREKDRDSQRSPTETEDEETGGEKPDTVKNGLMGGGGGVSSSPPCPARRSRVIRLYQYDEDGQRYCHLPDPSPEDPAPPPRLKQRSLSLTRLSAIMAAASQGPLDRRETGGEEREERPRFHMEI